MGLELTLITMKLQIIMLKSTSLNLSCYNNNNINTKWRREDERPLALISWDCGAIIKAVIHSYSVQYREANNHLSPLSIERIIQISMVDANMQLSYLWMIWNQIRCCMELWVILGKVLQELKPQCWLSQRTQLDLKLSFYQETSQHPREGKIINFNEMQRKTSTKAASPPLPRNNNVREDLSLT